MVERLIEIVTKEKEGMMLVYNNHDSRGAAVKSEEVVL